MLDFHYDTGRQLFLKDDSATCSTKNSNNNVDNGDSSILITTWLSKSILPAISLYTANNDRPFIYQLAITSCSCTMIK